MRDRIFGHAPGSKPGDLYANRRELSAAGVHRPLQAGISGSQHSGADSIVLSGGYEDDEDHGTTIIYTGHGGLDPATREMVDDQNLTRQNLALAKNVLTGNPVRVTRGGSHNSPYSPADGYRYDGLYRVTNYWREKGRSGHYVWRYRLEAIPGESLPAHEIPELPFQAAERTETLIQRVVRDTTIGQRVKALHDYHCQVCGERLDTPAGPYAESAHIRPLGHPHNGPDTPDNILCLCPNHHVLFDRGAIGVYNDLELLGIDGFLREARGHDVNPDYLHYHRRHIIDPLSVPMDLRGSEIPNDELTLSDVPTPNADLQAISDFALTYNGYHAWPDQDTFDAIVHTPRHDTLAELRTCLFYAQREAHWSEGFTDEGYVRDLIQRIRELIQMRP